jgi:hypothetical protein
MRTRTKTMLCAFTTTLALATAVASVDARRLEFSNQRLRMTWNPLNFSNAGRGFSTNCPVTLEGSFHSRTLSKVSGSLVGYVTRTYVDRANCAPNLIFFASGMPESEINTLPWHVRYDSFSGTLPLITEIKLQVIDFRPEIELNSTICRFKSTAARPLYLLVTITETGRLEKVLPTTATIPFNEGNPLLCPPEIAISGRGSITLLASATTEITVRLVQ